MVARFLHLVCVETRDSSSGTCGASNHYVSGSSPEGGELTRAYVVDLVVVALGCVVD